MGTLIIPLQEHAPVAQAAPRVTVRLLRWLPWVYLGLIALAESLTALVSPALGLIVHTLLLIGLIVRGATLRAGAERGLTLALTLPPLTRLIALALPLATIPRQAWYPIVVAPLLIAAWIVIRHLQLRRVELGLRVGNPVLQLMVMGCGIGIGVIEYILLTPAPLITTFSWGSFALLALVLAVATGFAEELIYRGLLQAAATPALGRWALMYVSLLFTAMHIGHLSALDLAFVFGIGLLFANIVRWSGSILGVSLAHSLTNITLFLVMPYVVEHPTDVVATFAPWVGWFGIAITIIAVDILMLRATLTQPAIKAPASPQTNIRALRRDAGLSYTDLSHRTGLPVRLIAEIEYGLCPFQPEHLRRIAVALGVTTQALIPARA